MCLLLLLKSSTTTQTHYCKSVRRILSSSTTKTRTSSSSSSSSPSSSSSSSSSVLQPIGGRRTFRERHTSTTTTTQRTNTNNTNSTRIKARKGMLFNQEMDEVRNKPSSVEFQTPLKIQLYPAKCLRMKNEQVTVFDDKLKDLAQQMFKIMYETDGCGLAAPQVGVNYRLMVYNESGRPDEGKEVVLVNPKISKYSNQKDFFEEGCLSFPEINAEVERPMGVKIEAQDIEGKKFKMTLEGFEARVFQHEYDHLDGVLFHDRMSSVVIGTIRNDLDKLIKDFGDDENEKAI